MESGVSSIHLVPTNTLQTLDVPDSVLEGGKILHVAGTFLMPKLDGEPTGRLPKRARDPGLTISLTQLGMPKASLGPGPASRSRIHRYLPAQHRRGQDDRWP